MEKESSVSGPVSLDMSIVSIKEAEVIADPDEDTKPIIKEVIISHKQLPCI